MSPRPVLDLRLYLVVGAADLDGRGLPAVVEAAVRGGVTLVQLREKSLSEAEVVSAARALKRLLAPHGVPLVINDHPAAVPASGADGLHVGQDDLPPAEARAIIGPDKILGVSAGNPEEAGIVDPALVDYVGVGPVRVTGTKADAGAAIGLEGLRQMRGLLALPMVAIGGIRREDVAGIMATGVEGVAVVSAICAAEDPEAAAAALRREIDRVAYPGPE